MTEATKALLDSNVLIAAVAEKHEHHLPSASLFVDSSRERLFVAAHSYAEAFTTLTRRGAGAGFLWPAIDAWEALGSVAAATTLAGLTPAQTFDTIRNYAQQGNIGARLYDRLIGQVAMIYGVPRIITWNVHHMRALFPTLNVIDPASVE